MNALEQQLEVRLKEGISSPGDTWVVKHFPGLSDTVELEFTNQQGTVVRLSPKNTIKCFLGGGCLGRGCVHCNGTGEC